MQYLWSWKAVTNGFMFYNTTTGKKFFRSHADGWTVGAVADFMKCSRMLRP